MLLRKLDKIPQTIDRRHHAINRMDARIVQAKDILTKATSDISVIKPTAKIADEKALTTSRLEHEAQTILDYSAQKVEAARSLVELLNQAEKEILNEIKLMESFHATKKTLEQDPLVDDYCEKAKQKIATMAANGLPTDDRFCICRGLNIGNTMVSCDNPKCPFIWFHVECVGISTKPTGSWFCPYCSQLMKNTTRDEEELQKQKEEQQQQIDQDQMIF